MQDDRHYPVVGICRILGLSKQAYYQHQDTQMRKEALESFVVEYIKEKRSKDPGLGGNKIWETYCTDFNQSNQVGYNRFYDIIEKYNLKVRKRLRRAHTTDSDHPYPLYLNLIKDLIPIRPCQVVVSDITYIRMLVDPDKEIYDFCYLSLITDYYTKEIVGYSVGDSLRVKYPIQALKMMFKHYKGVNLNGLIHHSDRGVQYACYEYTNLLKEKGIAISMTQSGNPKDNAVAERVNNTIKNEFFKDMVFRNIAQVKSAVKAAVDFYNNERPHLSLDGMTPVEASKHEGEIKKRWKSYREMAIKNNAA